MSLCRLYPPEGRQRDVVVQIANNRNGLKDALWLSSGGTSLTSGSVVCSWDNDRGDDGEAAIYMSILYVEESRYNAVNRHCPSVRGPAILYCGVEDTLNVDDDVGEAHLYPNYTALWTAEKSDDMVRLWGQEAPRQVRMAQGAPHPDSLSMLFDECRSLPHDF